ncbi:heme NO-binding domain-containing protein [uncultured Nocardioides sp.]|uniref:heme NO-binding domain-containing protein n=1 Tax=uncultured Nocardioides sp. TaxID=198441 RepID=UPI0025CF877D|nr:heme NO-binding domain-containing protein [uncultured Nocardioides sp.]
MRGIIFNMVEDAVTADHGAAAWDEVLTSAGVEGAWTALGCYPSSQLVRVIHAGSERLGIDPDDLTRRLGASALLGLADRYPHYFEPFTSTRPFLLTLNAVIHPEVRKVRAHGNPPEFWFEQREPGGLVVHYRSERRLCALAEGMIAGASAYFGERAELSQTRCVRDGADHCVIDADFVAA